MRNFFKDAITTTFLVAFTGALPAAAENVTMTELDGTTWESFTTTQACIDAGIKFIFDEAGLESTPFAVRNQNEHTMHYLGHLKDSAYRSLAFVDFETIKGSNNVVLRQIDMTYGIFDDVNNVAKAERTVRIAFFPVEVLEGVFIDGYTDEAHPKLVTIQNGEMSMTGNGVIDDTIQPAQTYKNYLQSCGLSF